jgi:hypothetical protein
MQENDRRFRQRFDMKVQVKILNLDSPDLIEQQVDSSNISARGVYSSTDLPLNIGARVEMSLTMPVEIAERIHGFGAARRLPPTSKAPSKRNFAFPATSWSHTEKACTLTIRLTYPPLIFRTTAFLPTKPATPVTATTASMAAFAPSSGALRHIYIQYFGTPPRPEDIQLYKPYNNRECLHCHAGARSFEGNAVHAEIRDQLTSNEMSCISTGCHDTVHNIKDQSKLKSWTPGQ